MTTAQYTRASRLRRGAIVGILVLGFVAALVLFPTSSRVEATGLFGGLHSPGDAAVIAGHRGDREVAPENTMPALKAALDGPVGFVETDIQLTKDLVPVLMHDDWIGRTTNGTGKVSDLTLAQIQRLDAGSWFSPEFAGTRVPTLETLLVALKDKVAAGGDVKALLELKGFWALDEVEIVTDLISQYELGRSVILCSFDPVTLDHAQEADKTIPRAIIARTLPSDPVAFAELYGAIAIITSHVAIDENRWLVDRVHRAGLGILVYTLNTKERWASALALGVDGIITDKPEKLDTWLTKKTSD